MKPTDVEKMNEVLDHFLDALRDRCHIKVTYAPSMTLEMELPVFVIDEILRMTREQAVWDAGKEKKE